MFIKEIVSKNDFAVKPDSTVATALDKMNMYGMHSIPYTQKDELIGLLSFQDLEEIENKEQNLASQYSSLRPQLLYTIGNQHIYDALQIFSSFDIDALPVINPDKSYLGYIEISDMIKAVNSLLGNSEQGAIIVLEIGIHDQSFSHIAHLIELENAKMLSMSVRNLPDSTRVEVTIKVAKQHISSVVASLWRHDYFVKATFNDGSDRSEIQDRYDMLMNYLDL